MRHPSRGWLGLADGIAAGVMAAAALWLAVEGWDLGPWRMLGGVALGVVLIAVARRLLPDDHGGIGGLQGAGGAQALLVVGVMTAHSFAEGIAVGVSFGGEAAFGIFITVAIAIHNIPEGLAISLVMVPKGASVRSAAWWSIFSSLPQPLMAVPAFLAVAWFAPVLPIGLGLAAGAMAWMVATELVPEALGNTTPPRVGAAAGVAFAAMMAFQLLFSV